MDLIEQFCGPVTIEPFRQRRHKTIHFPFSPLADAPIQSNLEKHTNSWMQINNKICAEGARVVS